ncbi:nucleotidyltransferase family protein [Tabrizicola sp. KVB23]|uniref:Nucleotidyltransferase family protein n=2 Tax=Fuscibacter oryzae TaxID=2803939 RepID=A0A8J7MR81_9RHOB|nr:nucleotidyltransferase family protein [Fuscibacter oryzae]
MAVAARFGQALGDLPAYPRLAGLQRMLWTKARMALREVQPPLAQIAGAGIPVMLLKGAARLAVNPEDQRSRISHDTDILVAPSHFARALDILTTHRWQPSTGESALCLTARLATTRAVNLFYGHFGDIDLHQWGYGPNTALSAVEAALWQNAQARRFLDIPVLVPAPEDRIALALSSSALDAHTHSDWLVDCARVLTQERVDSARLVSILKQADLGPQARVALSYLGDCIGIAVPGLSDLQAQRPGWQRSVATVLQMKPRGDWTTLSRLARGVAKQARKMADTATPVVRAPWLRGRLGMLATGWQGRALSPVMSPIDLGQLQPGQYRIDLALAVDLPGVRRRLELELNQTDSHVTRLRARTLLRRKGWCGLRFSGQITVAESGALWLESRPSKALRGADQAESKRYAALQIQLLSATIRPLRLKAG